MKAKKYCIIKKWKDGGEAVWEYFDTEAEARAWVFLQPKPKDDKWSWQLREWE